jgi:putative NADH-flavin reductase
MQGIAPTTIYPTRGDKQMKVVIFGASGGVGRCLVEQSLARHWHVTAAVRNPTVLDIAHERLRVVGCDVLDSAAVEQALAGQAVVFCALGARTHGRKHRGPTTLYSTGARNVVRAMRPQGVRRIVFLSNFGVLGEKASGMRGAMLDFIAKRFLRNTLIDHKRALEEIGKAAEWSAVRPLPMTNGSRTGNYRIARDGLPAKALHIARISARFRQSPTDSTQRERIEKIKATCRVSAGC